MVKKKQHFHFKIPKDVRIVGMGNVPFVFDSGCAIETVGKKTPQVPPSQTTSGPKSS